MPISQPESLFPAIDTSLASGDLLLSPLDKGFIAKGRLSEVVEVRVLGVVARTRGIHVIEKHVLVVAPLKRGPRSLIVQQLLVPPVFRDLINNYRFLLREQQLEDLVLLDPGLRCPQGFDVVVFPGAWGCVGLVLALELGL